MSPRSLLASARAAARTFQRKDEPLTWSEALAAAPWPPGAPPAWEAETRRAFALVLVDRGIAKAAARSGAPVDLKKRGPSKPTKLQRRPFSASPEEFADQDARAAAAGLSWSAWARKRLAGSAVIWK
jgi:hypothetical protein